MLKTWVGDLYIAEKLPSKKHIVYKCVCECGNSVRKYAAILRKGKTINCGECDKKLVNPADNYGRKTGNVLFLS